MAFFIQGMAMGFAIAAPVGPIALLCIQRSLSYGVFSGLVTGLGAAVVDAMFGAIAAFGLTTIVTLMQSYKLIIQVVGGVLLVLLALKIFKNLPAAGDLPPAKLDHRHNIRELMADFFSTVFLMLTNPMAILIFLAVFTGLNIGSGADGDHQAILMLVVGVFSGSMLWWGFLVGMMTLFRDKVSARLLRWVNIISGAAIAAFGFAIMLQALR